MGSLVSDRESILEVIEDKFNEAFKYFIGNGPLASTMYIDSLLFSPKEEKTTSLDELYNVFLSNDSISRSNVILGESGVGKSTLGLHICHKFWKDHEKKTIDIENDRIPIYIHLPSVITTLKDTILFEFLREDPKLVNSVAKLKLLLVLDGFDEFTERKQNICNINKWGYPPYRDVRVVILSRHEIPQSHMTGLFEFIQEGSPPPSATSGSSTYSEYVIQSFNSDQISVYIDRFDQFILSKDEHELNGSVWAMTKLEYIEHGWSKADYLKWFNKFRDFRSLAQTPLILSLIMQTLPRVCRGEQGSTETQKIKNFCKNKVGVFDAFTESWFFLQYKRLLKAGFPVPTVPPIHWKIFKEFCYAFGQNVAYSMISPNRKDKSRGQLKPNFNANESFLDKKLLEVNGNDYSVSREIQSDCIEILKSSQGIPELLEAVRIACLVKYSEPNKYDKKFLIEFFHRSLAEYFVSRDLFQGLAGDFDFYLIEAGDNSLNENLRDEENVRGLNAYLLREEGIILNLADRVKSDSVLKEKLFEIVDKSKNLSLISIMSANAISILNIGGISLSGHDFSWVQIPGANLSNSICGNTNFNGANLQNVSFENSWLFGAQFNGANLEGTRFGIIPNIPIENNGGDNTVMHMEIRQTNENWFLYGGNICETTGCVKIVKWDLSTLMKVKEYTTTCNREENRGEQSQTGVTFGFNVWNENLLCVWRENLTLFDLESGEELARVRIPNNPTPDNEEREHPWHGQVCGFLENQLHVIWGSVVKIFDIEFNPGSRNVLQLTLTHEHTIGIDLIKALQEHATVSGVSKFELPKLVNLVHHPKLGLLVSYLNCIICVDKDLTMTFGVRMIQSFDIDSTKSLIVIAGRFENVEIWSIDTKVRLKELVLRSPTGLTKTVIFSPDSKYIVSGSVDTYYGNSVTIWDNENDWSVFAFIPIDQNIPFSLRIWSTHDGQTTLAVATPQSIQLHPISGSENNDIISKMITRKKFITQHLDWTFCSNDGRFIATVRRSEEEEQKQIRRGYIDVCQRRGLIYELMQSHFKTKNFNEIFKICIPIVYHSIQISRTLSGKTEHEIVFPLEVESRVSYLTFIRNNRILCIHTTEQGTGTNLASIYDLEGNVLTHKTELNLPNCRFRSTKLNHDGTLIAFILYSGQIQLFKLTASDTYIQNVGCIPNSTINTNLKARTVSFGEKNPVRQTSNIFLGSQSFEHGPDDIPISNMARAQIWNIQDDSLNLIFESPQYYYFLPGEEYLSSFDTITVSNRQEKLELVAHIYDQDPQIVKITHKQCKKHKVETAFELSFWFVIKFVKFVPLDENNSHGDGCLKLVVCGLIDTSCLQIHLNRENLCCLQIGLNGNSRITPGWSILWSICSNLNLVVKDLCLNRCISMEESTFFSLRRLGAHADGQQACSSQEYISKSNLIYPILGSYDLPHTSILSCENRECLSLSDDNWILSAVGKKTRVPFLEAVDAKYVSHVFLALEGLKKGRRFITEAHLYVSDSDSKTYFVLRPVRDLEKFRDESEGCSMKQWPINRMLGERLLENILLDYQNHWEYSFRTRNCVSWCRKKLENVGIEFRSSIWDKFIVSSSVVLGGEKVLEAISPSPWYKIRFGVLFVLVLLLAITVGILVN